MSTIPLTIKAEYENALRIAVLRHGALTDPDSHAYGWIADDWEHKRWCKLTSEQVPTEAAWTEFGDSFTEHHPTKHGIDLPGVSCACGAITDRTMRWDAHPAEMIQIVLTIGFEERKPLRERMVD